MTRPHIVQTCVASIGLASVIGIGPTAWAQSVPGFVVSTYANNAPGPVYLAFAPDGILYCGRDIVYAGNVTPQFITRIGVGGAPVGPFGSVMTPDPDAVVVDVAGVIAGQAGSVLTGGVKVFPTVGSISAILPDQSVVELWSSTAWRNPAEMKFDHTGRLLFLDTESRGVWTSVAGESPTLLATLPGSAQPAHLTIAPDNRLFVSDFGGRIYAFAADGLLLDANVATFPSRVSIEFGPGGAFGTDLYALRLSVGTLHRVDAKGAIEQIGSGFGTSVDLAFGPDDRLYVSRFSANAIQVIEAETCFCSAALPADLDCGGTVNAADLAILLAAWGTTECAADLDGDGTVGAADLAMLLASWTG